MGVDEAVAGGPFDESDLDAPPDDTPALDDVVDPQLSPRIFAPSVAQTELRRRLDTATAPPAPTPAELPARFAPEDRPRIVDGLVVPARSVADSPLATWILLPLSEVTSIGRTARAVGVTPRTGRWLAVWIGDPADVDAVLGEFAAAYADARKRR